MSEWADRLLADVCVTIRAGGTPQADNQNFYGGETPFVTIEDISSIGRTIETTARALTTAGLNASAAWLVPSDHLLYSMYATLGKVTRNKVSVATNQAILAIKPDEKLIACDLLFYLLQFKESSVASLSSQTTQANLSADKVRKFKLRFPVSLLEQRRIAEILSTLDEAIEQTEALIAKHQQIKAGLMHDLFTRGVTPDGHLRPTRGQAPDLYKESMLGWIPMEWEVKPLRDLTIKIADRDHTTPEYVDDGVIMVSPTNLFDDEGIDFAACRNIPLRDHLINRRKTDIESGDLILHRIGAGLGDVRLVTDDMPEFSILHSMALVRPLRSAVSAEYLLWSFRSYPVLLQMDIGTQSIGVPDLGLDKIGSLLFPVAPHGEQTIIANSLRTQAEAGGAERSCLVKLRQQKHGLMHDLLTGRVRVPMTEQ